MPKLKYILHLLRPYQWYKNLVIFLPIIFVGKLFDIILLRETFIGFLALCAISSTNYIINDLIDRKGDKEHPEKRLRPLASGNIKTSQALILVIILFLISIFISLRFSLNFLYSILAIFILTQLYTFFLKKEPFLDILIIAINFVIRAVSGTFIINVTISPWLILCPFFLSLFLSTGKREADILLLKQEEAIKYKEVLKYYTHKITNYLLIITTTLLIVSYTLYSFLSQYKNLIWTLPVALYVIFRYFHLIYEGSIISRHPEKILRDWKIVIGILLWVILILFLIY